MTRAHPPTPWTPTRVVLDADARDLARLIRVAAQATATGKVELVLHSFGTLVFQRMLQLVELPEVAQALLSLAGSRVVLLNATTHYPGSERIAGPEFERMAAATVRFVDGLDLMDAWADLFDRMGRFGRWIALQMFPWSKHWPPPLRFAPWTQQRAFLIELASREASDMMRRDLEPPWAPEIDGIRRRLVSALKRNAADAGWQEALLRRSSDMFRLNFTSRDVRLLKSLDLRLDLVHSTGDALLNWKSAQIFFKLLGIDAPETVPAPGAVLSDRSGLWRALIVEADHYFPLKNPRKLARILDP